MYLEGHYQNAYVTHNLDAAMKLLDDRYGKQAWIRFDPDMIIRTPAGPKEASVRVGLVWYGGLQIELIQPNGGYNNHYEHMLPADTSDPIPRFHHTAHRREDRAAMRAEIEKLGLPLAFEGDVPGAMEFVYLDGRESIGHFLEYVWATPEGWNMNGWPKNRPVW